MSTMVARSTDERAEVADRLSTLLGAVRELGVFYAFAFSKVRSYQMLHGYDSVRKRVAKTRPSEVFRSEATAPVGLLALGQGLPYIHAGRGAFFIRHYYLAVGVFEARQVDVRLYGRGRNRYFSAVWENMGIVDTVPPRSVAGWVIASSVPQLRQHVLPLAEEHVDEVLGLARSKLKEVIMGNRIVGSRVELSAGGVGVGVTFTSSSARAFSISDYIPFVQLDEVSYTKLERVCYLAVGDDVFLNPTRRTLERVGASVDPKAIERLERMVGEVAVALTGYLSIKLLEEENLFNAKLP